MPEIETPPFEAENAVVFTDEHSWADVVRWICRERADAEEVQRLLSDHLSKAEG